MRADMRLLMLPRYEALGASSRLRSYQYLPKLSDAGIDVTVSPLLSDAYVRALYGGGRGVHEVVKGYWRRVLAQLSAEKFDIVWLEKEFLPWMPPVLERIPGKAILVVDFDDAVFHRYDEHRFATVRRIMGTRIDQLMRRADVVTAGNDYLANRALEAGCQRVATVPTVVDLTRYSSRAPNESGKPLVIGWIGSPSTAHYLRDVSTVIASMRKRYAVRAVAVGARPDQVVGTPFETVPWSEAEEAAIVAGFDIGIMPLIDAPWERGKCGYKLIQYMACGVPVIASPVGVNREIVQPGFNGFLAGNETEWEAALTSLIIDADLRDRMGSAGRWRVEQWYSLQVQAPRLIQILQEAAQKRRR
jgi:glycosyltransferase involved in cell wall biosynthesis